MSKKNNEDKEPSRKTRFKKIHNQVAAEYRLEKLRQEEMRLCTDAQFNNEQQKKTDGVCKVYICDNAVEE
jgi:hypothetical protein